MQLKDADELKKAMERMLCIGKEPDKERYTCDVVCCVIDEAPSVDAEPIRHGHWIWCETYLDGEPEYPCELLKEGWTCSACGAYLMEYLQSHFHDISSYAECISDEMPTIERCPHCGAKMDAEVADGDE